MNTQYRILLVLIFVFIVFVGGCTEKHAWESNCTKSGGHVRSFPDTCVDSCAIARQPTAYFCGARMTTGCDCNTDKCWNGSGCEWN